MTMNDKIQAIAESIDKLIAGDFEVNKNKLNGQLNKIKKLINEDISSQSKAYLHYFMGNIYLEYYYKKANEKVNKTNAIKNYLNAIEFNPDNSCKISLYNNLGNIFLSEHRYYEAVLHYQKSIEIDNYFLLPFAQQIRTFEKIWKSIAEEKRGGVYKEFLRLILLKINKLQPLLDKDFSVEEVEQRQGQEILKGYQEGLGLFFKEYYQEYNKRNDLAESIEDSILIEGESILKNNDYVIWCRDNGLLLNFMNLIIHAESLRDDLILSAVSIEKGSLLFSSWKILAQEFCYSRYIFYKHKDLYPIYYDGTCHTSDLNNFIRESTFGYIPTLRTGGEEIKLDFVEFHNDSLLNFEFEEMKSAYLKLYNILDKISVFLFFYIRSLNEEIVGNHFYLKEIREILLGKSDNGISLATFGCISKIENLRNNNPCLFSFVSIYEDVVINDIFDIKKTRNLLTHNFLDLSLAANISSGENLSFNKLDLSLFISRFKLLMEFVRCQLFNTVSTVRSIESCVNKAVKGN